MLPSVSPFASASVVNMGTSLAAPKFQLLHSIISVRIDANPTNVLFPILSLPWRNTSMCYFSSL
jgi:hypothetical protein